MTEIIGVKFKSGGKQYYFAPNGLTVRNGQGVIVETGKGLEYGICSRPNGFVEDTVVVQPLRPVIRIATPEDERTVAENGEKERRALRICQEKIEQHELDMKLVGVEYAFDGTKVLFFFTSEGRVDFRSLVKDLASTLHARIELRQIGVRDEARMLGGIGICGKPFCCSQFLNEFQPVSIKMAKTQNLSLNPTKISGSCGRLMCCLKYEQDAYEDAVRRCPKNDSFVECPDGVGNIAGVNLLREQVKVRLEDSNEQPKTYRVDEIRVVRSGKGKRPEDYVAPPLSELEKLRFVPIPSETPAPRHSNDRLAAALESILSHRKEEPETPAQEEKPAEQERSSSSRHRNRGSRGGRGKKSVELSATPKTEQAAPKQQPKGKQDKPAQTKQGKAAPDKSAPAKQEKSAQTKQDKPAQSGEEKSGNSRHRHRHRPRHRGGKGGNKSE